MDNHITRAVKLKHSTLRFLLLMSGILGAASANAVAPLSQYGQIQNVQNYSSNPFWSPNAPYNQRVMPTPVYATGPDVSTSDCQTIVANLVAVQCAAQNRCSAMRVSDIRPYVIQGLARLPGHNFATACAGYIDDAFNTYVNQYANTVQPTSFPAATGPANTTHNNDFKIQNPYAPRVPDWAADVKERASELQQLQSQNGAGTEHIAKADFPTTINDVSFADRMENLAAGYAPYKDASAYAPIKIEPWEASIQRELEALETRRRLDEIQMPLDEYCAKYFDEARCPDDRGREQEIIALGNSPTNSASTQPQTSPATQEAQQHAPQQAPQAQDSVSGPQPRQDNNIQQPEQIPPASVASPVVANNRIHDGPCTPSARSKHFRNTILTTGKYENIDPAFNKMMVQIFRVEGDCGGHPKDPGGYTCYGYAQRYNPDIDVRQLTPAGAEDRTYERFYLAKGLNKLPDSIRGDVLRGDFGSGPGAGVKKLQKTLGLPQTGNVDDTLIRASEEYNGDLHNAYWNTMQDFYVDITRRNPERKVFLKGWMNGVRHFRENGCHVEPEEPLTR